MSSNNTTMKEIMYLSFQRKILIDQLKKGKKESFMKKKKMNYKRKLSKLKTTLSTQNLKEMKLMRSINKHLELIKNLTQEQKS